MDAQTVTPNEIHRTFTTDYTSEIHHAMRADGQWFMRYRVKDARFGYRNTAWTMTSMPPCERACATGRTARLPR